MVAYILVWTSLRCNRKPNEMGASDVPGTGSCPSHTSFCKYYKRIK